MNLFVLKCRKKHVQLFREPTSRFRQNEQQLFRKQPRKQDDETLKSETENFEPKHATWNNLNIYFSSLEKNCADLENWSVVA